LIDAWEREWILREVFVEINVIHTYPPFILV
jgi:hypothetical protein